VPDAGEFAPLIRKFRDTDPATRALAATEIFARGSALARLAIHNWLAYAPFERLVVRNTSDDPEITVGIAIEPEAFELLRKANGSPRLADVPPDQDAREFELDFPGGVRIDILTTREPGGSGAIARYLARFGEGIQQIEISVTDVDGATEILRTRFAQPAIYRATRSGADGTRVNFFLAPTPEGGKVLIELVEKP
jgi:hypothetical protein